MNTPTLGEPRFAFTHTHPISDELRIPERIEIGAEPGLQFELAGPRGETFFRPETNARRHCDMWRTVPRP